MKKPKVLLLGYNFASVMNSLAEGFEQTGVPYKAITFDLYRSHINQYQHVTCVYKKAYTRSWDINRHRLAGMIRLIRYIMWCDVVHIFYDTAITKGRKELSLFRLFKKKKCFINFLGSDVRNPEVSRAINPFFSAAFDDPGYEYKQESAANSDKIQQDYATAGFLPIVWDTDIYINPAIFPKYYIVPHAAVNTHQGNLKEQSAANVLIVHSPSAPVAKGTKYVEAAIAELERRNVANFTFRLLKNIPNELYQQYVSDADILVDQVIWGAYGIASVQALAVGKVVVCYLLPQRIEKYYGKDCPIVNANANDLADVLHDLVQDFEKRKAISRRSRAYYEQMHAPAVVAEKMLAVYNDTSA